MDEGSQDAPGRVGVPAASLRRWVSYHGYDMRGWPPGRHRGLPSPYLTLIVTIDEPLHMLGPDGSVISHDAVIGGLHTEPVDIVHRGGEMGIHVALHPLAARALFGMPSSELAVVDLDAQSVLGTAAREMYDRVGEARDWSTRFAALDDVLTRRLTETGRPLGSAPAPELGQAWRSLVGPGGASVRSVADDVGWSDRHLGVRFRAEFGVTPKVAARMARFDRARRMIGRRAASGVPLGLADVAADGGFADQAHLAREFRSLAGVSPTQWLADEVGIVQDTPVPGERG